jgi:hypothetical protein
MSKSEYKIPNDDAVSSADIHPEATLSDADLSEADLSGANLRRADLSGANLGYADLSEANLRRADLFEADLSYADLSEADLSYADLSKAILSEAILSEASLAGANLSQTIGTAGVITRTHIENSFFESIQGMFLLVLFCTFSVSVLLLFERYELTINFLADSPVEVVTESVLRILLISLLPVSIGYASILYPRLDDESNHPYTDDDRTN